MTQLPVLSCDGCSSCCQHIRTPPFIVSYVGGEFKPQGDDRYGDYQTLLLAPREALIAFAAGLGDSRPDEAPCSWLDQENKRCRWHEHRPPICRDFEVAGEDCLKARSSELHIVQTLNRPEPTKEN